MVLSFSFGKLLAQAPNKPPILIDIFLSGGTSLPSNLFLYQQSPTVSIPVFVAQINSTSLGIEPLRTAYPNLPTTTVLIRDLNSGNSSFPREYTNYKNSIYFFANSTGTQGSLWSSGATSGTTNIVLNIYPGGNSDAKYLTVSNNLLFFAARNSADGSELWRSDGTAAGTVKDININTNGALGSFPESLTNVNIGGSDFLFFSADNSTSPAAGTAAGDRELWVRTSAGAVSQINLKTVGGSNPKYLRSFNSTCVFFARDETKVGSPYGIWTSTGTPIGTNAINLGAAALVDTIPPVVSGNRLFFVASDVDGAELWVYNGVNASKVRDINPGAVNSTPRNLADIGGVLYFAADSVGVGVELFKSDGTAAGTKLVANIKAGSGSSFPSNITKVGNHVFFFTRNINLNPAYVNYGYLYYHTPATNSTGLYYDFASAQVAGSAVTVSGVGGAKTNTYGEMLPLPNGGFYFVADGDNGRGQELWYSEPCPTLSIDYDPVNGNIVCNGNTAVSPVIRQNGAIPLPTFNICPDNTCFSSPDPNLVINPATGVINPSASPQGSYVVNYDYNDGFCIINTSVSITIQQTVTADLLVERVAGTPGTSGGTNSTLLNSTFNFGTLGSSVGNPFFDGSNNMAFSPDGTKIYVADEKNHCIRQVDLTNDQVTVLAGDVNGVAGSNDGIGNAARFEEPAGIDTDDFGIIYVADKLNHVIRRIDPSTRSVTTIAGTTDIEGDQDSTVALKALFSAPTDVAVDKNGNIYVADRRNHKIRKITTAGHVITLAGKPNQASPNSGFLDSNTPDQVLFFYPSGIDVDNNGLVYVADQFNHRIRLVQPSGATTTLTGGGASGGTTRTAANDVNGNLTASRFFYPSDIHISPSGKIFIADRGNHKVKVIEGSTVSTYAGSYVGASGGYSDGIPAANAEFRFPNGVLSDLTGQVYIIDKNNQLIRRTVINNPAGNISGGGTFCAYSSPTATLQLSGYNGEPDASRILRWERTTQSSGAVMTFPGNTATLNAGGFPLTNETYTYRAIVNIGTCGELASEPAIVQITAPALPTVTSSPVCLTTPTVNVIMVATGAFDGEYRWYDSTGTTLLGTNDTLIRNISSSTNYLVSIVKGTCETPRVAHQAVVYPLPTPSVSMVSPAGPVTDVCLNDVITYQTPSNTGATYSWLISGNGSFVGDSTSNSVQIRWHTVGAGTLQVTEVINGCSGVSPVANLNVRAIPTPSITGSATACVSDTTGYTVTNSGNAFLWSIDPSGIPGTIVGGINNQAGVSVLWSGVGTGRIIIQETITATGCDFSDTLAVTINPKPAPVASGDTTVCAGETNIPYSTPNTGNTFLWTVNGGTIVGPNNQNAVTVNWGATGVGSLIIEETITATGCAQTDTLSITINPLPNPVITGNATICNSDTIVYRVTNTGNNFSWSVTNGVIQGSANLDSVKVFWNGATSGQIRVRETIATTGCFADDTLDITINALPAPAISGNNNVCQNNVYTYRTNPTGNAFNWTVTNGSPIGGSNLDSIQVRWDGASPGQLILRETILSTGCFSENTFNVTINPLPTPVIPTRDTVCTQDTKTYTVLPTGNSFNWIVSGGTVISGANSNSVTIQWNTTSIGQAIIEETTLTLGCVGRDTIDVLINPLPNPFISGNDTLCQGATEAYSVISTPGHTYFWTVTGGMLASGQGTNAIAVNWNTGGTGQVQVRETITATGCFKDTTLNILIQPQPVPVITGSATVCLNDTRTYRVINTGNTYNWSVSNGTVVGLTNLDSVVVRWTGPDPGRVVITETVSTTGCLNRDTLNVTINPIPNPVISGNGTVCQTISERYQVTNTGNSYLWSATNGTIVGSNTADSVHVVWNADGQLIVRETILATGCFWEDTLQVIANPIPSPAITGGDTVCTSDTEIYHTLNNPGSTYQWFVSTNGTIVGSSTADSVRIAWNGTGTGQVRLRETISSSGCVFSDTLDIFIIDQPITDITYLTPNPLCAGDTGRYQAVAAPAGLVYLYTWTVQGGTVLSGQGTSQLEVAWNNAPSGTEYVLVTIQVQGSNCNATTPLPSGPGDMGFVSLNPLPNPVINSTTGMGDVCQFSIHQYGTTNDPANTYIWSVTGGNIIAGDSTAQISVEWTTVGAGTLTLTQTIDATGCTVVATPVTVNVLTSPDLPTSDDRNLCADGTADLYAIEPTATQFNWYNVPTGGTPLATTNAGTPYTTAPLTTGGSPYTFYVSGLNAAGCEGQRTPVQVTVDPSVTVQVVEQFLLNVETCNNDTSGVLQVGFIGDSPYTYNVSKDGAPYASGSVPFGTDSLTLNSLGIGTYVIDITDDGGCTGTGTFTIISAPKYISSEFITSDTLIAEGESITLRAGALDAQAFEWRDSLNNVLGTDSLLTITPPLSATYSVLITNDKGCDTTLYVRVDVIPLRLFVPNVFSPNGDNRNDRLQVYGTGIKSLQLRIFDRLGQLIYESDQWIEGANFDDTIGWDGTYKSKLQQNGNYVWSVNGQYINNQPFKKTGNVLLSR